jgi:hypothetical protein
LALILNKNTLVSQNQLIMPKVITLLSVLLILTGTLFAQKCKPFLSTKDAFTNQTINVWGGQIGSRSSQSKLYRYYLLVGMEDTKPFIMLYVIARVNASQIGLYDDNYSKGSNFSLKTSDGVFDFEISSIAKTKETKSGYYTVVNKLKSFVEQEQLEKLASTSIENFRVITSNDEFRTGSLSSKAKKRMNSQLKCFLDSRD